MTEHVGMPLPPMSADDVLRTLAQDQPDALADALASAEVHREALIDRLLDALERGLADLLARHRRTRHSFRTHCISWPNGVSHVRTRTSFAG
jgi:hypothetical protein